MHFGTEGQFRAFLTKNGAPPDRQSLICVDYLSDYNWERLDCVKDRIKESKTHNKQHTHSLSDGIQAGSSPRSFRVVALGTVRRFRLYNKPQRRVWWKPGALSAGFPAADTLENTSVSGFLLASFFGTPGVGRPCCAQGGMLTLSGQGGRREEEGEWSNPPAGFPIGRRAPSCGWSPGCAQIYFIVSLLLLSSWFYEWSVFLKAPFKSNRILL